MGGRVVLFSYCHSLLVEYLGSVVLLFNITQFRFPQDKYHANDAFPMVVRLVLDPTSRKMPLDHRRFQTLSRTYLPPLWTFLLGFVVAKSATSHNNTTNSVLNMPLALV